MINKTIRNAFFSGAYQLLILIVPLITTPYVTRIFSPSQLGVFGTSLSLVGFFVVFGAIGTPYYGSREIAKLDKNNKNKLGEVFISIWIIQVIVTLISFICYISIVRLFINDYKSVYLAQSLMILVNLLDISWFYVGLEEIKKTILRNFLSKIFIVFTIFLFVKNENDFEVYIFLNIIGLFIGNLFMVKGLKNYFELKNIKFNNLPFKDKQLRTQFRLMNTQLFNNVKLMGDKPALQLVSESTYSVGIYDQGKKIITIINQIATAMSTAVMPKMTALHNQNNKKSFNKAVNISFVFFNCFSIIFIPGTYAISQSFVSMFFGNEFGDVRYVLLISIWSLIFLPGNSFIANAIMLPLGKDKEYLIIRVITSLLMIVLILLLGGKYSFVGASLAFLFTEIFMYVFFLIFTKEDIPVSKIIKGNTASVLLSVIHIIIFNVLFIKIHFKSVIFTLLIRGFLSLIISIVICIVYIKKVGAFNGYFTKKYIRDIFRNKKNL